MGGSIFIFPSLQELEELLRPPLLEETHERALDSLHLRARHFGDLAIAVHETTGDLLELQVASDVGVDENTGQFS